jgi:ATP-dependent exoDNAse (exonuclease V) alpha subunit
MDHRHQGVSVAIAFAKVSIHSRAKGHSAVAAAAYRAGVRLTDERTGLVYDFSHRKDVIFSELLLPESAFIDFKERSVLWNQVEFSEHRQDAQVCKDIVLALPKELDLIQQIELTTRFAQTHFVENGLAADVAIHDHGDGNPHAHILITTRRIEISRLSKYKARDLNPAFARSTIIEKELWGEKWRESQKHFSRKKISIYRWT